MKIQKHNTMLHFASWRAFFFNTDQVHYLEKNKARDFTKHRPYVSSENETSDSVRALTEGVIFFFLSCSFCTLRTGVRMA